MTLTLERPAERRIDQEAVWKLGGAIVGQTALLTALLLYFGWARTKTTYGYFGIDVSLLDLSTTDFVLNSVNSAYNPLLRLGLVALAGLVVHELVTRSDGRASRAAQIAIVTLGLWLCAFGTSALLWTAWSRQIGRWVPNEPGLAFAWLPVTLAAGFALLAYACTTPLVGGRLRSPLRLSVVLAGLFVLAAFWAVSLLAVHDGLARAKAIERDLPAAPRSCCSRRSSSGSAAPASSQPTCACRTPATRTAATAAATPACGCSSAREASSSCCRWAGITAAGTCSPCPMTDRCASS